MNPNRRTRRFLPLALVLVFAMTALEVQPVLRALRKAGTMSSRCTRT